jgi:hypothetical protein
VDLAYWWSCIGEGLRLQPAQQACFYLSVGMTENGSKSEQQLEQDKNADISC